MGWFTKKSAAAGGGNNAAAQPGQGAAPQGGAPNFTDSLDDDGYVPKRLFWDRPHMTNVSATQFDERSSTSFPELSKPYVPGMWSDANTENNIEKRLYTRYLARLKVAHKDTQVTEQVWLYGRSNDGSDGKLNPDAKIPDQYTLQKYFDDTCKPTAQDIVEKGKGLDPGMFWGARTIRGTIHTLLLGGIGFGSAATIAPWTISYLPFGDTLAELTKGGFGIAYDTAIYAAAPIVVVAAAGNGIANFPAVRNALSFIVNHWKAIGLGTGALALAGGAILISGKNSQGTSNETGADTTEQTPQAPSQAQVQFEALYSKIQSLSSAQKKSLVEAMQKSSSGELDPNILDNAEAFTKLISESYPNSSNPAKDFLDTVQPNLGRSHPLKNYQLSSAQPENVSPETNSQATPQPKVKEETDAERKARFIKEAKERLRGGKNTTSMETGKPGSFAVVEYVSLAEAKEQAAATATRGITSRGESNVKAAITEILTNQSTVRA